MKKIILLLLLFLAPCFLHPAMAQQHQRGKFKPDEFKAKLENYITQKVGFTQEEAQAFYPIYFEMKGKQRQLQRKIFWLKKNEPCANAADKDFAIAIQKIKDLGVEMAELEVSYYKKLCGAVSPRKVYAAMRAEDEFHRQMLENFDNNRPKDNKQK
jgi:hypothetical protein